MHWEWLSPPGYPRRRARRAVVRPAILALCTYALGLIPFYFLTPVHQALPALLAPSAEPSAFVASIPVPTTPPVTPPPPSPTLSMGQREVKDGAVTRSIVDPTTPATLTPGLSLTPAPVPDARYAVLLLGYGGADHAGGYLTDSLMLVMVDPDQKTLTLLSLPRDSWVPLQFDGRTTIYNKLNTAYAFARDPSLYPDRRAQYTGSAGAGTFAADSVARLLGIPVRSYLALDFAGFRQAIDAVGGIDVDAPDRFKVRYPANDDSSVDARWITLHFHAGWQHMTGERAIEYARAREALDNPSEATDFARSERQRRIVQAFKARLVQPGGLLHLPQLIAIATHHVDTNESLPAVTQLSQLILGWKNVRFFSTALTVDNYLEPATGPDGAYLLVPNSQDHSWGPIQQFARRLWNNPALGVALASTRIVPVNASDTPGLAMRVGQELETRGYLLAPPTTGPPTSHSRLIDRTGGKAPALVDQLRADLGNPRLPVVDGDATVPPEVDLELGTDLADLSLATPSDAAIPASRAGVVDFGAWSPEASVSPTPSRPTATATPVRPLSTSVATAAPRVTAATSPLATDRTQTPTKLGPTPTPGTTATAPPALTSIARGELVRVPDLRGQPASRAAQLAARAGLTVARVESVTLNQAPNRRVFLAVKAGEVFDQFPEPGQDVPRGTRVYLVVRKE